MAPKFNGRIDGHILALTLYPVLNSIAASTKKIRKFYRAANHIFRIEGKSDDLIMLNLIETHCIPILTYAIEVIVVSDRDIRRQLRVAYNSVFRRIFNYRTWQSVSQLQSLLSRPTWEELLEKRTEKFCYSIRNNSIINVIFPPWMNIYLPFVIFCSLLICTLFSATYSCELNWYINPFICAWPFAIFLVACYATP